MSSIHLWNEDRVYPLPFLQFDRATWATSYGRMLSGLNVIGEDARIRIPPTHFQNSLADLEG